MSTNRFAALLIALSTSTLFPNIASAGPWSIYEIGNLGGTETSVYGINSRGQVVGQSDLVGDRIQHAFLTGINGVGITDLTPASNIGTSGRDINASGQIIGNLDATFSTGNRGFITNANGAALTAIGTFPSQRTIVFGLNDLGQAVGDFLPAAGSSRRAFVTDSSGLILTELGTLGGNTSRARDLNDRGQIIGRSSVADTTQGFHAFITGANGVGMRDLGTLGGNYSEAFDINSSGQVIGVSTLANSPFERVFITGPDGVGMVDIGSGLSSFYSFAGSINSSGQVAGYFALDADELVIHAFVTAANGAGAVDLNSLVTLADGNYFTYASGINDRGQIVANSASGRAYLLTPSSVPEPGSFSMLLTGMGLAGFVSRQRMANHKT